MGIKDRLTKVAFPACARELASQSHAWQSTKEKLIKGGVRAVPFVAVMLIPQIPVVTEFLTTLPIPVAPEIILALEERVVLWAASKTALFAGKYVDPWFDRKFDKKTIEGEFVVREPTRESVSQLPGPKPLGKER